MKYTIQTETQIELDVTFPAYYKSGLGNRFALFHNEETLLYLNIREGAASISQEHNDEFYVKLFVVQGAAITAEEFASAFLKASAILTGYLPEVERVDIENEIYEQQDHE